MWKYVGTSKIDNLKTRFSVSNVKFVREIPSIGFVVEDFHTNV